MTIRISGKKLFGRFAWYPCAQERLDNKLMLQNDFDEMKSLMERNADLDIVILTLCFPIPVRELRAFARVRRKNMWSHEMVHEFLRQHRGSGGNCTVRLGIVDSISPEYISVIIEGESTACFNTYQLKLKRGSEVLIHRRVIIKVGF